MKVKHSIFPFIPIALAMVFLKLMGIFGTDGNGLFLGLNNMGITYAVIGGGIILFIICIIINLFDRKTAPVYPVHKNPISGVLSVLAGIAVLSSAATTFLNTTANSDYYYMTIATLIFSIPAAIAFFLMSKVHFVGKSTVSGISFLFIFPSIWGCAELVSEFLIATRVSISATDLTALFCYIFITLFLFSNSMVLSRIKGRNPVKGCFIYGLPAVALSLTYGIYIICTNMIEGMDYSQLLVGAQLIVIALYALSFIIEMTIKSYTKDEIEIIDGLPDDSQQTKAEEEAFVDTKDYDDLVFASKDPEVEEEEEPVSDSYFNKVNDFDDFITGYDVKVAPEISTVKVSADASTESDSDTESTKFEFESSDQVVIGDQIETINVAELAQSAKEESEKNAKSEDSDEDMSEIDRILQELESKK